MIITKNCCICEPSELMQLAYDKFKRKHNQGQGPTPSASDRWKFLVAPGQRSDSLVADTDYIDIAEQYPGTVDLDSLGQISVAEGVDATLTIKVGSGYSITGNTLTITSVGGAGDRFATLQEAYDAVATDDLLGEPTLGNPKYVKFIDIDFSQGRFTVESVADVDGTDSTITTSEEHGLEIGDFVRLVSMTVTGYNSGARTAYEVKTVPSSTTFTIELAYSATATGVAVKQSVLTTDNVYVGVIAESNVYNLVIE